MNTLMFVIHINLYFSLLTPQIYGLFGVWWESKVRVSHFKALLITECITFIYKNNQLFVFT